MRHVINCYVSTSTSLVENILCKDLPKVTRPENLIMGSILAKGNDNLNNNNGSDRHDIFMDCSSDILSSPSSTLIANHIRQPSIRSRNLQPMPIASELDRRFARVLVSWLSSVRDASWCRRSCDAQNSEARMSAVLARAMTHLGDFVFQNRLKM